MISLVLLFFFARYNTRSFLGAFIFLWIAINSGVVILKKKEDRDMEYDLVNRPHEHPLLFEEEGNFNGVCSRCRLQFYTAGFKCSDSDCNFHIHQSCIHLPPRIHSLFHPQHPLHKGATGFGPGSCNTCGQRSSLNEVYRCSTECSFQMDIKCAIADTKSSGLLQMGSGKYQHFSHPHPLTLLTPTHQQQQETEGIKKLVCVVCQLLIESGSSNYFCSQCDDGHFHKECAELPRKLQNLHRHHHHLFLLPVITKNYNDVKPFCNSCQNRCIGFVYSCPQCKFFLHVTCLQSNHKHTFTMLRTEIVFICGICGMKSNDRLPWFCDSCHILVDKKCAELPLTLRPPEHSHDLTFDYFSTDVDKILCKICGKKINTKYAAYGCSECNYFTHLHCAQGTCADPHATDRDLQTDSTENGKDEKNKIPHFCHPGHDLTLFPPEKGREEYRVCDGCMKCLSVSGPSYGCGQCDFFLHEECAQLPTTKTHLRLHPHLLTLISIPNFVFQCEACLQHFQGFAYHCKTCLSTFDVRCASIQIPFQHPNHPHPLYPFEMDKSKNYNREEACEACGKKVNNKLLALHCTKTQCNFYLDLGCATLPVIVRYRFDPHPLNLTFVEEERIDEYCCDICEEEREPRLWFYSCRKCSFAAHPRCALGEFPYVKSTIHKSHKHPLSLVMKTKRNEEEGEGGGYCGACNKSCAHNLAFECGACNFNVHATGRCYDLQVLERKVAFTNHNVFSRANQPYDCEKLIQNLPIIEILGPFGKIGFHPWKELVFSTIRAFVVYHDEWGIHWIQIQYAKNGELVWSEKHPKEKGTKSEVSFDYPDEYLVSIHGSNGSNQDDISSLTLQTNRKTYGPFGDEDEDKFSSVKEGVKIIGIFGSTYFKFSSIGFHGISTQE